MLSTGVAAISYGALGGSPITIGYIDGEVVLSVQEFRDSVGEVPPHDAKCRPTLCVVPQQLSGVPGDTVRLD